MIRVGIIGCGKIADQHASEIQKIEGCEIVGVCDREELMAKQMFERFNVKNYFSDVNEFLEKSNPDIVHITTPPQSHFELGKLCLNAGSNVYIEKPFTLNTKDAEEIINFAEEKNLKITVGHNLQYNHSAIEMRKLIKEGFLGGDPIHIESYYCYDLGDPKYAKSMLGDKNHWVRKLPGKLLHNLISHGIGKIAEFLKGDSPHVIAHGFTGKMLRSIDENEIIDELRVIINDDGIKTAYFTFSTQIKPTLRHFRVYGPKNALIVDDDNQTVIKVNGNNYKSYLNQFVPPLEYSKQYLGNSLRNMGKFIRRDFHTNYGMSHLIKSFYKSVTGDGPLPITYREILNTSRIMDSIFKQIYS